MDDNEVNRLKSLGAFEISDKMLKLAQKNVKNNIFLDAGRGNPNWINTKARLAFARMLEFGVQESRNTINEGDLAGYIETEGIRERFEAFLDPNNHEVDKFFQDMLVYLKNKLKLNLDEVIAEFANGVIGNDYPVPSRVLKYTQIILNEFLESVLYKGQNLAKTTQLFPTEGGTAAIVYLFHSLAENHLIKPGDKIAINTPIFTPYLQIPELNDYRLVEVSLRSEAESNWEIKESEFKKLLDPSIKALFLVNPSNPASKALSPKSLDAIKKIVEKKPNLMIFTDDVYGTFVKDFQSVYAVAPHNTVLVYSFSKLYGATGWRVGLIGINQDNVFDKLISQLDEADKEDIHKRYETVVYDPTNFKFIDRMVADSRSVGLYHTSGLSTPQQIMEDFFALTHLVYAEGATDPYIEESRELVAKRYDDLHRSLGTKEDNSRTNAMYYSLINIYRIAENLYGKDFRKYLEKNFGQIDFLLNLAKKNGVVLMDGVGFGSKPGELRVSQANLPTKDYALLGKQVLELLGEYHKEYEAKKSNS